jgi:hypothetical protein
LRVGFLRARLTSWWLLTRETGERGRSAIESELALPAQPLHTDSQRRGETSSSSGTHLASQRGHFHLSHSGTSKSCGVRQVM